MHLDSSAGLNTSRSRRVRRICSLVGWPRPRNAAASRSSNAESGRSGPSEIAIARPLALLTRHGGGVRDGAKLARQGRYGAPVLVQPAHLVKYSFGELHRRGGGVFAGHRVAVIAAWPPTAFRTYVRIHARVSRSSPESWVSGMETGRRYKDVLNLLHGRRVRSVREALARLCRRLLGSNTLLIVYEMGKG